MVSFSCENCGDVLTKKKLDPHRNQCYGASYTCLDCMVHFEGNSYRTHTSCITEDQKYQGKLYKEKKPKGQPNQQRNNNQQHNSQALVPRNAYVEDATDGDNGALAVVDAPPRAPSPPPAAHSLGYEERAALPPVNVFDFLDGSATPKVARVEFDHADESRMIEDSQPPAYEDQPMPAIDAMMYQVPHEEDAHYSQNGFTYGGDAVRPTSERYESFYTPREQPDNYTTPAPKSKHSRKKSGDKDLETTSKKTTDRKRKRSSPPGLDMSLVRAQHDRDAMMLDAPMLHSGLTGGLNRLLARPEFPPSPQLSPDHVDSPLSPMKRAKQGTSKALARAQRDWELQQEKDRKEAIKEEKAREKAERKEKERGRDRERKEVKASTALAKIKPKKRRDDSARPSRRVEDSVRRRRRQYSSSASPEPERKIKAIEYHRSGSAEENGNGALIVRENGELAPVLTDAEARAELFMSLINKGPESGRGMSVNKTLKRYHRERYDRFDKTLHKGDEEKELWKNLRLKRNDRGEIVLFYAEGEA